jgi:RNA polymerase sigma factor (TIGR02999 family)
MRMVRSSTPTPFGGVQVYCNDAADASTMNQVTRILSAVQQGDPAAARELLPLVYDELRRLASQRLEGEKPGQTLQATALVHEAYLRLVDVDDRQQQAQQWNGRAHFFAAAAEAMRRILIDNARRRTAQKRGGDGWQRQGLEAIAAPQPDDELLALDEALGRLAALDPANQSSWSFDTSPD